MSSIFSRPIDSLTRSSGTPAAFNSSLDNCDLNLYVLISNSSVGGVLKRQGTLIAKSTRGFLGRILDFLGILLIGWALTNLPKIIEAFQKLIKRIQKI